MKINLQTNIQIMYHYNDLEAVILLVKKRIDLLSK